MIQVHTCRRCGVTQKVNPDQTQCFDSNCAWPLTSGPPGIAPDPEPPQEATPPAPAPAPPEPPSDYQKPLEGKGHTVARRPGRLPSDGRGYRVLDAEGNPVEGGDQLTEQEAETLANALDAEPLEAS